MESHQKLEQGLAKMKNKSKSSKPKYLSLDPIAKQQAIENLINSNLEQGDKQIAKECMIFTEELESRLKDPKATLKEIKHLFELRAEAIKKVLLMR